MTSKDNSTYDEDLLAQVRHLESVVANLENEQQQSRRLIRAYKSSHDQLNSVMSHLSDTVIVLDSDASIRFINQKGQQMIGTGSEHLIGKSIGTIFDQDEPLADQILLQFLEHLNKIVSSDRIAFYRQLSSLKFGAIFADHTGTVSAVNQFASNLLGYTDDECLGKPVDLLVPHGLKSRHGDLVDSFFDNPSARFMQPGRCIPAQRKDGSETDLIVALVPTADPEGVMIVLQDKATVERWGFVRYLLLANLVPTLNSLTIDRQIITRLGEKVRVLVSSPAHGESEDRIDQVTLIIKDVSEMHKMSQQYQKGADLFEELINASNDLIYIKNNARQLVACNKHFALAAGLPPDRLSNQSSLSIVENNQEFFKKHAQEVPGFSEGDEEALNGESVVTNCFSLEDSQRLKHYELTKSGMSDAEGNLIGVLGIARDTTSQSETLRAYQLSEQRLKEAQRIASIGNWDLDLVTGSLHWSDEVYRIFELDPETFEATYDAFLEAVHPDDREVLDNAYTNSVESHEPYSLIHRLQMKDGTIKHVSEYGKTFYDEVGNPIRSIGTVQDISARIRAEAERDQLELKLREAQKMETLGTLAGGIAHDFNNILTPILGYAGLLKRSDDLPCEHTEKVDRILQGASRASDLVAQILLFSRRAEQTSGSVSLRELVSEVTGFIRSTIPASITIRADVHESKNQEDYFVIGDASQLYQVVLNLCTNAWQAIDGPSGEITVTLRNAAEEDSDSGLPAASSVFFSVEDTGRGMSADVLEKIFDPFFSTKSKTGGTGLGLSVVHGIVVSHGGKVQVKSEEGRGTMFSVMLPAARETQEAVTDAGKVVGGSESILVIDDDLFVLQLVESLLITLGYSVTCCTSPEEGLNYFQEDPDHFNLVITDYTMPSMTGLDVIEKIRALKIDIPVILMTGYSDGLQIEEMVRELNTTYMLKPLSLEQVSQAVRTILDA